MKKQDGCGAIIKQIHDKLEKNANNALRSEKLTMTQIGLLVELYETEGNRLTMKEIENQLGVAQPTVAGIVKRLEQKKFVETFGDERDKRIKIVHLLKAGVEKCENGKKHMNETETKLLASLTENEKNDFKYLLQKVRDSMDI